MCFRKREQNPLRDYIKKRQTTVAEWETLIPIFEVCAKDTGDEGGGGFGRRGDNRRLQNNS